MDRQNRRYGDLYAWNDVAIKHYGLSKLVGPARRWRDSLPRQERSWRDWAELLRENFPCQESALTLTKRAQSYKRRPNQDIAEYYEKLARCNEAGMKTQEIIEWIVDGLDNARFRDYLGPLSRYEKPSQLLPDLQSGSTYIREVSQAKGTRGSESTAKS